MALTVHIASHATLLSHVEATYSVSGSQHGLSSWGASIILSFLGLPALLLFSLGGQSFRDNNLKFTFWSKVAFVVGWILMALDSLLIASLFSLAAGACLILATAGLSYGFTLLVVWRRNRFFLPRPWRISCWISLALVVGSAVLLGVFSTGMASFFLFSLASWTVSIVLLMITIVEVTQVNTKC